MIMKITKEKNVLENQETNIIVIINTTLRLESLVNHENERLGLHNRDDIISRKWIINVYIKKDDNDRTKLRDYEKRNVRYRIRN